MKLLVRYRRHGDVDAEPLEVTVEADDYGKALTEARARAAEDDDLLSVQVLED